MPRSDIQVTGYLIEVGDFGLGRRGVPTNDEDRGFELECESRYVKVTGLTKPECTWLAGFVGQKITIAVTGDTGDKNG